MNSDRVRTHSRRPAGAADAVPSPAGAADAVPSPAGAADAVPYGTCACNSPVAADEGDTAAHVEAAMPLDAARLRATTHGATSGTAGTKHSPRAVSPAASLPRLQTARLRSVGNSSQPPRASAAVTPCGIHGRVRSSKNRAQAAIVQTAVPGLASNMCVKLLLRHEFQQSLVEHTKPHRTSKISQCGWRAAPAGDLQPVDSMLRQHGTTRAAVPLSSSSCLRVGKLVCYCPGDALEL